MLQIKHITKKYQNFTALKDIDDSNSFVSYRGIILWNGRDIQKLDDAYREKLGFLSQDFGYYRDYSPERYLPLSSGA